MPDYIKALEEGFERGRRAEVAEKEINDVFRELNEQISKVTDGKVAISRKHIETEDYRTTPYFGLDRLLPKQRIHYWAIVAYGQNDQQSSIELARWEISAAGYPCKIKRGTQDIICEDKEGLGNCLADLLTDPYVGRSILKLMQQPSESKGKEA